MGRVARFQLSAQLGEKSIPADLFTQMTVDEEQAIKAGSARSTLAREQRRLADMMRAMRSSLGASGSAGSVNSRRQ
jgi:hypothetical protein